MHSSYIIPFILSVTIHSAALLYGVAWIEMPVINLEYAPSALEICIMGSEVVEEKEATSETGAESRVEEIPIDEAGIDASAVDGLQTVETRDPSASSGSRAKSRDRASVQSMPGDSTFFENSQIGVEYVAPEPLPFVNPTPHYPRRARERDEEGTVILEVEIMVDGSVGEVVVADSSGYWLLDQAAIQAIQQWRFRPAYQNGEPVPVRRKIPVIFRLK